MPSVGVPRMWMHRVLGMRHRLGLLGKAEAGCPWPHAGGEAPRASPPVDTWPAGVPRAQAEARRFLGALAQRCQGGGGALVSAAQLYALADALELAVPDTPAFIAELNDAGAPRGAAACAPHGPARPRSFWARSQAGRAGGGSTPVTLHVLPSKVQCMGMWTHAGFRAVEHEAGLSVNGWRGLLCMLWVQWPILAQSLAPGNYLRHGGAAQASSSRRATACTRCSARLAPRRRHRRPRRSASAGPHDVREAVFDVAQCILARSMV